MEVWDDIALNRDDEQALRILSLTVFFTNKGGASTADVARTFYPELDRESFQKAFRRDRDKMALCGVIVNRTETADGDVGWELDEDASLAGRGRLTAQEALELVVAVSPMASDPSFAYSDELRHALAKVANSFAGLVPSVEENVADRSRELKDIRACLEARELCRVDYTSADGTPSTRIMAPLGFFGLRGKVYVVGAQCPEGSEPDCTDSECYRVFLVDRFSGVKRISGSSYRIPPDFDIADYIRLPFQIGDDAFDAVFFVPAPRIEDVRAQARGRGTWEAVDGGCSWTIPASNYPAAASWAVAEGVEPRSPKRLVDAWNEVLREVIAHG